MNGRGITGVRLSIPSTCWGAGSLRQTLEGLRSLAGLVEVGVFSTASLQRAPPDISVCAFVALLPTQR